MKAWRRLTLWRYAAAVGIIAATTGVAELLYRLLDTTRLSMVFLTGVLVAAVTLGAYPAYFAALLAFCVYNIYLVEPRFTLQLVSAEDVLVLIVFLAVAMLTGGLAGRLRDAARRNLLRARATNALFEASRTLSSVGDERSIRDHVVRQMAAAVKGEALLAHKGEIWRWPPTEATSEAMPGLLSLSADGWRLRLVRSNDEDLGLAAWRPTGQDHPDEDGDRLIHVLVDLGTAAIARARLATAGAELAARARTEQLRTALLSSISHDLRTPLSAILASASSLKTFGGEFPVEVRMDLVETIEEEAERLNRFVANLLSMTKLESGALQLETQNFDIAEVINRCVQRATRKGLALQRDLPPVPCVIAGDPILLEQALDNVLENAMRYGGGSPAALRLTDLGAAAMLEIEDGGPGVAEDDHARIFEKFYRAASAGASQGTGLGLSITRGLVEAMNGTVAASARPDGRPGLLVSMLFAKEARLAA